MTPLTIESTPREVLDSLNVLIEWYNDCEIERERLKDLLNVKYGTGVNANELFPIGTIVEVKHGDTKLGYYNGAYNNIHYVTSYKDSIGIKLNDHATPCGTGYLSSEISFISSKGVKK